MFRREQYNRTAQDNQCRHNFKRKFDRFMNESGSFGRNNKAYIPVNIAENEEFYQVQVFAAGRSKEQFQVNINDQILTIS